MVRHYETEYLKKVSVATNATGIRETINMSWPSQRLQYLNKSTYLCAHKFANLCDMSLSKFREIVKDRKAWHTATHEVDTTQSLNNKISKSPTTQIISSEPSK